MWQPEIMIENISLWSAKFEKKKAKSVPLAYHDYLCRKSPKMLECESWHRAMPRVGLAS